VTSVWRAESPEFCIPERLRDEVEGEGRKARVPDMGGGREDEKNDKSETKLCTAFQGGKVNQNTGKR